MAKFGGDGSNDVDARLFINKHTHKQTKTGALRACVWTLQNLYIFTKVFQRDVDARLLKNKITSYRGMPSPSVGSPPKVYQC